MHELLSWAVTFLVTFSIIALMELFMKKNQAAWNRLWKIVPTRVWMFFNSLGKYETRGWLSFKYNCRKNEWLGQRGNDHFANCEFGSYLVGSILRPETIKLDPKTGRPSSPQPPQV